MKPDNGWAEANGLSVPDVVHTSSRECITTHIRELLTEFRRLKVNHDTPETRRRFDQLQRFFYPHKRTANWKSPLKSGLVSIE